MATPRMFQSEDEKLIEILRQTEEVADVILMNKQEIVELDKRRQGTREAIREIEKSDPSEKKFWVTVGSNLIKFDRETALKLLRRDQNTIEIEINKLRSEQKVLVNKHRDLEFSNKFSGTDLKPLDKAEFDAFKANFPML